MIDKYNKLNSGVNYNSIFSDTDIITQLGNISKFKVLKVPIKSSVIAVPISKTVSDSSERTSFTQIKPPTSSSIVGRRRVKRIVSHNHLRGPGRSRSLDEEKEDANKGRKGPLRSPDIDGIIHGIMKLLGGNVKLKASESPDTKLTTFGNSPSKLVSSTRINNRGPPRLPPMPFGILPPGMTRPPIRPPIRPPTGMDAINAPPFVANTRPPFLVPLPPALTSFSSEVLPTITGIPIPEDVLSNISPAIDQEDSLPTDLASSYTIPDDFVTTSSSLGEESSEMQVIEEKITTPVPINSETKHTLEKKTLSHLESSMVTTDSSHPITSETEKINLVSTAIKTFTSVPSTTQSEDSISTSNSVITSKSLSSKTTTKPLFTPPSKVTEEATSSSKSFSYSDMPTRLPGPIRTFATTGHPGIVLEDTVDPAHSTYPQIITAPSYGGSFGSDPQMFDVTVSALQGYGAQPPSSTFKGI